MANPLRDARIATRKRQAGDTDAQVAAYITPPSNILPGEPSPIPPSIPTSKGEAPYLTTPPSWWQSMALTPSSDSTSFLRLSNALIPYMSGADQTSVGVFLGTENPTLFSSYLGSNVTPNPTERADTSKSNFLSSKRAATALANLDAMAAGQELGPGYQIIRQALGLLSNLGINSTSGEQGMTRAEYEQLQSGLNAIVSQAQGNSSMAPYAELAQKLINPTLLGGNLMPSSTVNGNTVYGRASSKLYK